MKWVLIHNGQLFFDVCEHFTDFETRLTVLTGAAVGPLLAGVIESSGWNNVFYMLIGSDIMALLVSSYISYHREYTKVLENIKPLQTYISHGLGDLLRLVIRRIRNMDFFSMISSGFIFTMMFIFYLNYKYNSWQWDRFSISKCYGIISISIIFINKFVCDIPLSFICMDILCIASMFSLFSCESHNMHNFFFARNHFFIQCYFTMCIYNFLASVHDIDYRTIV